MLRLYKKCTVDEVRGNKHPRDTGNYIQINKISYSGRLSNPNNTALRTSNLATNFQLLWKRKILLRFYFITAIYTGCKLVWFSNTCMIVSEKRPCR